MAQNDYVPVSWNGEVVTNDKLNQMCNNDQFLFDRTPLVRYTGANIIRDNSVKIIAGKTPFAPAVNTNWVKVPIYFGSFFTVGSHPSINVSIEPTGPNATYQRIISFAGEGTEIDHTGFNAMVWTTDTPVLQQGGWIHWQAVGY